MSLYKRELLEEQVLIFNLLNILVKAECVQWEKIVSIHLSSMNQFLVSSLNFRPCFHKKELSIRSWFPGVQ